jgi:hypothetical protein
MGLKTLNSLSKMTKTQSMVIQPTSRKFITERILPEYESNVGVDEFGSITTITTHQTDSCLLCAQLLSLYKQRHSTLIFTPDTIKEQLKRLKAKQSRNWDEMATVILLSIYQKSDAALKPQLLTEKSFE